MAVERAEITVLTKGLDLVTLFGQAITLEEAYNQTLLWLPILGKSDAQLKDYLSKVKADYSGFDDRDFGAAPDSFKTTWYGQEKERYTFLLAKAWNEQAPLRLMLYIDWDKHWNDGDRKTHLAHMPPPEGYENEPIQVIKRGFGPDNMNEMMRPPSGYEHISLEPQPDSRSQEMNSAGLSKQSQILSRPQNKHQQNDRLSAQESSKTKDHFPWLVIITIAF